MELADIDTGRYVPRPASTTHRLSVHSV